MQVIYAAPFILLSLIAFACSLAISKLRPYAFRALVAPVAFGSCSIVAMVLILVGSHGLGLQFANYPLAGMRGVLEGIAIYLIPGLLGAWIAVEIVRQIETKVLNTQHRRDFAIRTVIALIIFGPAFIVCTGVQFKLFSRAEEWWPLTLVLSFIVGALAAVASYLLIGALQKRAHTDPNVKAFL
jgi:hypothetical protein